MRSLLIVFFIFLISGLFAQQFADKEYYLADSLLLEELTSDDKSLIDSCLKIYHTCKEDTDKINIIQHLVEESLNDNVWPKYNQWVYTFIVNKIAAKPSTAELTTLKSGLAGAINNIGYLLMNKGDLSNAMEYYQISLKLQEEINDKNGAATSLNNIGYIYKHQGNINNALEYYQKSLIIAEEIKNKLGIATALSNIAFIYDGQGNIEKSLEYYHKCLKIQEEIDNKQGVANSLNNIGAIYLHQGDFVNAVQNYNKSLSIREKIGDKKGTAESLNNLGIIYTNNGDATNALVYHLKGLKIQEDIGDKKGLANSLNNVGDIYYNQNNIDKAMEYFNKSYQLHEELGNKLGIAIALRHIGNIEIKTGDFENAETHLRKGLKYAKEVGSPVWISYNSYSISELCKLQGNYKEALEMYEQHIQMRDSINNEETQKSIIRQQTKYEFEKEQLVAEQQLSEELRVKGEKLKRRDNLQYSIILVGILVVFGLVLSLGFISISPKFAEGLIFFAFLILFEFLLVLSDPYVDRLTNGEPMYKLLLNAILAGAIFPLHSFFENNLKLKLIRNRKI